jgi:hypothetical protein
MEVDRGTLGLIAWWQQGRARRAEHQARACELSNLRRALYEEVAVIANQCLIELGKWRLAPPPPTRIEPRTARLPPLVIFQANAGQAGLLSRDENIHLIGFSGTLHDLSIAVSDMIERELQDPEIRQHVAVLLSNACCSAAMFLAAVPGIPDADKDRPFIETLGVADRAMHGVRQKVRDQSDTSRADLA